MALIIPNAGDTTSGNKYEALDQAEPDALDFEILSLEGSGVIVGGEVTTNNSATNVSVSAGTIVVGGVPYVTSAVPSLPLPAAPADNRFDLVVARVSGGSATVTVVQGENSSINPSFPRSTSTSVSAFNPLFNVNPATDVVLAALYRSGSSSVTASRIIDKRVIRNVSIILQGTSAPIPSQGSGPGSLYFRTTEPNGVESGVWVKKPNGTWIELAQNVGGHFPIGGVFAWPTNAPVPLGCSELNGQAMSVATYPALFAVYGYLYGGSGGTFFLPNWNNRYLRGTTSVGDVGDNFGTDNVTLGTNNLPRHRHEIIHTHGFTHSHGGTASQGDTAATGGNHSHGRGTLTTNETGNHYHPPPTSNLGAIPQWWWHGGAFASGVGEARTLDSAPFVNAGHSSTRNTMFHVGNDSGIIPRHKTRGNHKHNVSGSTSNAGGHTHAVTTTSQTGNTTTSQSTDFSAWAGQATPTAIDKRPASAKTRWVVRSSLGPDPTYTGGTPAFDAAFQETFVVELYAKGETVAEDVALGTSFRMPWAGTITDVRAAVGVASDTGPIVIDVNKEGGSLLGTKLSIDEAELTSTTATTPHTISQQLMSDDALVTFDVDSAGANAEGPLTVTLYITRNG